MKNTMMTTAAMAASRFRSSPQRLEKNCGTVIAPRRLEYRRMRRATMSQLIYVPTARPMAVQLASASPVT